MKLLIPKKLYGCHHSYYLRRLLRAKWHRLSTVVCFLCHCSTTTLYKPFSHNKYPKYLCFTHPPTNSEHRRLFACSIREFHELGFALLRFDLCWGWARWMTSPRIIIITITNKWSLYVLKKRKKEMKWLSLYVFITNNQSSEYVLFFLITFSLSKTNLTYNLRTPTGTF